MGLVDVPFSIPPRCSVKRRFRGNLVPSFRSRRIQLTWVRFTVTGKNSHDGMIRKATEECGEAVLAATDELEGLCQDLYQNKGPGWTARRS